MLSTAGYYLRWRRLKFDLNSIHSSMFRVSHVFRRMSAPTRSYAALSKSAEKYRAHLEKFVQAQDETPFADILRELKTGKKRSHWSWYGIPQLKGLGTSHMASYFGIANLDEARAYLEHPVLGQRLRECVEATLELKDRTAVQVFGGIDALKYRSCLTLFAEVEQGRDKIWERALEKFYEGKKDPKTLELLARDGMK